MSNINLLGHKDAVSVQPVSGKLNIFRVIAIVMLFSVSAASVILYILIAFSPLPQVQQQEQQALAMLSQFHPDMTKIALIQDRVNGINAILAGRNKYDKLLDSLQGKLNSDLTIYQLSISKNTATVTVRSNSLPAINDFLEKLVTGAKQKEFQQVILTSIYSDNQSNFFSTTVTIGLL